MEYMRITVKPDQMGGVACIRGLRIPVATVLAMMADGLRREAVEALAGEPGCHSGGFAAGQRGCV